MKFNSADLSVIEAALSIAEETYYRDAAGAGRQVDGREFARLASQFFDQARKARALLERIETERA